MLTAVWREILKTKLRSKGFAQEMYVVFQNVTFQIEAFYSFDCGSFLVLRKVLLLQMQFWSKSYIESIEHEPLLKVKHEVSVELLSYVLYSMNFQFVWKATNTETDNNPSECTFKRR